MFTPTHRIASVLKVIYNSYYIFDGFKVCVCVGGGVSKQTVVKTLLLGFCIK